MGRNNIIRRFDRQKYFKDEKKTEVEIAKSKRMRKKSKLIKALENIKRVEEAEKEFYEDYYDYNYGYPGDFDAYISPDPLKTLEEMKPKWPQKEGRVALCHKLKGDA